MDLFGAVMNNDLFAMQEALMEQPDLDVNALRLGTMTPLHVAAEKGYASCVTLLLSAGAEVDAVDEFGCTPLMSGVGADWPMIVQKLLAAHSDCNRVSNTGQTALHMAARLDSAPFIHQLIAAGADANAQTSRGDTPLSLAIENNANESALALLYGDSYVNPNMAFSATQTLKPVQVALREKRFALVTALHLNGYKCMNEVRAHIEEFPMVTQNDVITREVSSCLSRLRQPLGLQTQCRICVRRILNINIRVKSQKLGLPQALVDYICYKDVYTPMTHEIQ